MMEEFYVWEIAHIFYVHVTESRDRNRESGL